MKQADMIDAVVRTTKCTVATAKETLGALFQDMADYLAQGQNVKLPGIATLSVKPRAAGMWRNPRTGEAIEIPPSHRLRAKIAPSLKEHPVLLSRAKAAIQAAE